MENDFVGREDLDTYDNAWGTCNLFGVFGIKTIGKSRAAKELIKRRLQLDPTLRHVIIDMQGKGQLKMLLMQLLSKLGLHNHMTMQSGIDKTMELIDNAIQLHTVNSQFVMVLDNCENFIDKDEHNAIQFCSTILQSNQNVKIIITSSVSLRSELFSNIYIFFRELSPLSHEESYKLLKSIAPALIGQQGKVISELCGGLPLVIMNVGK